MPIRISIIDCLRINHIVYNNIIQGTNYLQIVGTFFIFV